MTSLMNYNQAIKQAVNLLPSGSRRLRGDCAGQIASRYGVTESRVRADVERAAKARNRAGSRS